MDLKICTGRSTVCWYSWGSDWRLGRKLWIVDYTYEKEKTNIASDSSNDLLFKKMV